MSLSLEVCESEVLGTKAREDGRLSSSRECKFDLPLPFFLMGRVYIYVLNELDDVHPQSLRQCLLLSLPIQMLIFSTKSGTVIPRKGDLPGYMGIFWLSQIDLQIRPYWFL